MPAPSSEPKIDTSRPRWAHRRILELPESVADEEGNLYTACVFASAVAPGSCVGWLQFRLQANGRPTVSTGQETVLGTHAALTQWALRLGPAYVRGALQRALRRAGRLTKPRPRLVGPHIVVCDDAGARFEAHVFLQEAEGHIWIAWIEFEPEGVGPMLVTHYETSQPSLGAAISWASRLEPPYFKGAFERARLWSCPGASEAQGSAARPPRRWPFDH